MPRSAAAKFSPGFRLSGLDIAVLAGGVFAAAALSRFNIRLGIAVAFVVGHFFLFCNVLRLSRPPELIWAGVFAALAIAASIPAVVSWPIALSVSAALTLVLAIREFRRPSYHGVAWSWINPQLPAWWSEHNGGGT
jgi:hypothetical protein